LFHATSRDPGTPESPHASTFSLQYKLLAHSAKMVRYPPDDRKELVIDVWARVRDILFDGELDATLGALSQTSRQMHHLVAPKLYEIVRLRNYKALCLFMRYDRRQSIVQTRLPDGHTAIQHVEIECEPDLNEFFDYNDSTYPISKTLTCFIKTRCQEDDNWREDYAAFAETVLRMLPTEHLRWEHTHPIDKFIDSSPSFNPRFGSTEEYKSIEFPSSWQNQLYEIAPTAILLDAKSLGKCRPSYWYTDPDETDEAGHIYKRLHDELRDTGSVKEKPMYIVQMARPSEPPTRRPGNRHWEPWHEKGEDRQSCGILTDFAIMEKMGLATTKIVSIPEEWEPEEWRKWVLGEGLVPGNGVQADLRAIEE